jgi:CRP-like cAMP-binding protein
VLESKY